MTSKKFELTLAAEAEVIKGRGCDSCDCGDDKDTSKE